MSEVFNDSFEYSNKENNNDETIDSYSLLFDKAKHNFSTSSEISFMKNDFSPIESNETIIKETTINNIPTDNDIHSNPWLLLFVQNDQQDIIVPNIGSIQSPIHTKQSSDEEKVTEWVSPRQGPITNKTNSFSQQRHSKR